MDEFQQQIAFETDISRFYSNPVRHPLRLLSDINARVRIVSTSDSWLLCLFFQFIGKELLDLVKVNVRQMRHLGGEIFPTQAWLSFVTRP